MKKLALIWGVALLAIAGIVGGYYKLGPQPNPDPNHTHADFAVWIDGKQFDFTDEKYMSGVSTDPNSHPTEGPRKYLHLHDGNGHVIHRHKPGQTFGDFLESVGFSLVAKNQPQWNPPGQTYCLVTPDNEEYCNFDREWGFLLNGNPPEGCSFNESKSIVCSEATPSILQAWDYVFMDEDTLLLSYSFFWNGQQIQDEYIEITADACRYSQTCPWKGKPPTENCIADPEVPCVL